MKRSLFIAQQALPIACSECKNMFVPNGHTGEVCIPCVLHAVEALGNKVKKLEEENNRLRNPARSTTSSTNNHRTSTGTGTTGTADPWNSWNNTTNTGWL